VDPNGNSVGPWRLVAPGQFLSVVSGKFGTDGSQEVFGLGIDHRVYMARYNTDGTFRDGWGLVAPGFFDSLAASKYGTSQAPILFGLGTASAGGGRLYAARFTADGAFRDGWSLVASGPFQSLAAGRYGAGQASPELFGIGVNNQVSAIRFTDAGVLRDTFALPAGAFTQLTVANHADGTLELFGLGTDHRAYAAQLNSAGTLAFGWMNTAPGFFSAIAAASPLTGNTGGVSLGTAENLAAQRQPYVAIFNDSGTLGYGWNKLATGLFANLGASAAGRTALYGLGFFGEKDDPSDNVNPDFFRMPSGFFAALDLAD
jgi:hypothetical protein